MLPDGALAERVALVTGGGSGLGRAMALELGRLGAKVAVLGRRVVGIVLDGTFHCSRELGRRVIERGGDNAQVVNIVASYAWTGGPGTVHSAAAKAGVVTMTRTLAVEWARHGIRVNAIAPGPVDTEETRERLWPTDEIREHLLERIPLRRFGTPEEVAHACAYLVSDYASYVTGDVLTVDGGAWLEQGMFR